MKKVLLAVAMVAFALTSNAQLWFGGALGAQTESNVTPYPETKSFYTYFSPKVGFGINDKFSVGVSLSYAYDQTKDKDEKDNFDKTSTWSVAPFARYAFAEIGDFSVLAEGILGFGQTKYTSSYVTAGAVTKTTTKTDMSVAFAVTPVLSYEVSDHFNLEFGMNFLTIGFYHYAEDYNAFKFGASSTGATLGFIYKL